jgi:hypothetical protein
MDGDGDARPGDRPDDEDRRDPQGHAAARGARAERGAGVVLSYHGCSWPGSTVSKTAKKSLVLG